MLHESLDSKEILEDIQQTITDAQQEAARMDESARASGIPVPGEQEAVATGRASKQEVKAAQLRAGIQEDKMPHNLYQQMLGRFREDIAGLFRFYTVYQNGILGIF